MGKEELKKITDVLGCVLYQHKKAETFNIMINNENIATFNKNKYFYDVNCIVPMPDNSRYIFYREGVFQPMRPYPIMDELIFSKEIIDAFENKQIKELRSSEQVEDIKKTLRYAFYATAAGIICILLLLNLTNEHNKFFEMARVFFSQVASKLQL